MPNLIGTGNNQVPTNGMLGGLAYQSPDNAVIKNLELTNLSGHNSLIPSNAVDVFVYDTRKDSDGGAWRKRTHHTSWYNETLNTATRGSRRDFPAVAIIVASTSPNRITIYDGDDPDMPMWMVFTSNANQYGAIFNNRSVVSIVAMNGSVILADSLDSVIDVSFIRDNYISTAVSGSWNSSRNILDRNPTDTNNLWTRYNAGRAVIAHPLNDVAITVLPNAPIDPSTGLPVPTIAVATAGGVSVIRDDGIVASVSGASARSTSFIYKDNVVYNYSSFGTRINPIPVSTTTDSTWGNNRRYGVNITFDKLFLLNPNSNGSVTSSDTFYHASSIGLTILSENTTDNTTDGGNGMVAYLTNSYNTGWMHGNIRGAWLSDTSTASVTGTELVINGDMSSSTGWSVASGISISGGVAVFSSPAHGNNLQQTSTQFVAGRTYVISFNVTAFTSGGVTLYANYATGTTQLIATSVGRGVGIYSYTWTATTNGTGFTVQADASSNGACILTVDNVSIRIAELDRSVNNRGLAVYGTLTKTAVATGADLVSYGGFSPSNRLMQPYNSVLDFGTGDFCFMCWFRTNMPSWHTLASKQLQTGSSGFGNGNTMLFQISGTNKLTFRRATTGNPASDEGIQGTTNVNDNTWRFATILRRSNITEIYVNGVLENSQVYASGQSYTEVGSVFEIGNAYESGSILSNYSVSNICLVRISSTAPSPDQIRKIYNDEKVLFQENSKAVLFGSSSAVTALAYDDTTKLLHVGTSGGRSDFQGLERINNTTTAVTTAISASNGLIAEQ